MILELNYIDYNEVRTLINEKNKHTDDDWSIKNNSNGLIDLCMSLLDNIFQSNDKSSLEIIEYVIRKIKFRFFLTTKIERSHFIRASLPKSQKVFTCFCHR